MALYGRGEKNVAPTHFRQPSRYVCTRQSESCNHTDLQFAPAYYCNVALMQTCNEMYSDDGNSSPKALYHLSQTFNHVTRLLAGPDALSDSTIMIVVTLISQELIRKADRAFQVHVDGLQKMICLRGGLPRLEENPALLFKVCK